MVQTLVKSDFGPEVKSGRDRDGPFTRSPGKVEEACSAISLELGDAKVYCMDIEQLKTIRQ